MSLYLNYAVPLGHQRRLHLLECPLELGLLLLAFLELPLDSVNELLARAHLLQLLVPHHAVPLEGLHSPAVVIQDLRHLDAHVALLRGAYLTQLLGCYHY